MEHSILKKICKKVEGAEVVDSKTLNYGYVDTGSLALNKICSGKFTGGFPIGNLIEIAGESSTAKTVFVIHSLIEAQKKDFYTVFIDNEQALSLDFAIKLGLDVTKLIYICPKSMEDCFQAISDVIAQIREVDKDTPIVVGYDSVGASPINKELEAEMGNNAEITGALRAKVAGQCLRKLNQSVRPQKALVVVVNQLRGTLQMYGPQTTRAGGGRALKFYCGIQLLSKSGKNDIIYDDLKNAIGIKGTLYTEKNKVTVPFQSCGFEFYFDAGLNRYSGLEDVLIKTRKIVVPTNPETGKESKGWYALPDMLNEKFRLKELPRVLKEHPELLND